MDVVPSDSYLSAADAALLPAGVATGEWEFKRAERLNAQAAAAAQQEFLDLLKEGLGDLPTRVVNLEKRVSDLELRAAQQESLGEIVMGLVQWTQFLTAILTRREE